MSDTVSASTTSMEQAGRLFRCGLAPEHLERLLEHIAEIQARGGWGEVGLEFRKGKFLRFNVSIHDYGAEGL